MPPAGKVSVVLFAVLLGLGAASDSELAPYLLSDVSSEASACRSGACSVGVLLANRLLESSEPCDLALLPASAIHPEGLRGNLALVKGGNAASGHILAVLGASGAWKVGRASKSSLASYLESSVQQPANFPQLSQNV